MLPVLVFCACVYFTNFLWRRSIGEIAAVGEVAATTPEIKIRPQTAGALVPLPADKLPWKGRRIHGSDDIYPADKAAWEWLDYVDKGDLLVKLDDRPARESLKVIKDEIKALEKQLEETKARIQVELADRRNARVAEARRLATDVETRNQDILDRQTQLEGDRIQLKRRAETLVVLEQLVRDGVENAYTLADSRLRHDTLAKEIKQQELALAGADANLKLALKRQAEHLASQGKLTVKQEEDATYLKYLGPIRQAIAEQEVLKAEMDRQIANLEIHSPISGQIVIIGFAPGETVQPGDLIMEIVPERGDHFVSYIPENRAIKPEVGDPVRIRVRSKPPYYIDASVGTVGTSTERMPVHQCQDPNVPQWGRPIKIFPKPHERERNLSPGQLVDVSFPR